MELISIVEGRLWQLCCVFRDFISRCALISAYCLFESMLSEPLLRSEVFLKKKIEDFGIINSSHIHSLLLKHSIPKQAMSSPPKCSTKEAVKEIMEHFESQQENIACLNNSEKAYCSHVVKYTIVPLFNMLNKWKVAICKDCLEAQDLLFFNEYQIIFERFQDYVKSNNNETYIL